MVFLPTVLKRVPGRFVPGPRGDRKLIKITKVPAKATGRDDYDRLPRLLTVTAHCAITATVDDNNTLWNATDYTHSPLPLTCTNTCLYYIVYANTTQAKIIIILFQIVLVLHLSYKRL